MKTKFDGFLVFFFKECLPSFGKENGCVPINHYCYEEGDVWSDQRPVAVLWHRLAGNGPFQVSSESQEYYFTEIFTTSYLQFYNMHEYATHLKKNHALWKKISALNLEPSQHSLEKKVKAGRYFRY